MILYIQDGRSVPWSMDIFTPDNVIG